MKYYLVAGERSGDLHASSLIEQLKKLDPKTQCRGIGGDMMNSKGMELVIHYSDLAFMGFWEVFKNILTIRRHLLFVKEDMLKYRPDVLILVDYPGFNLRLAEYAHGKGIKVFYYISPKIWAWNSKRVYKIRQWVDKVFVILPFETSFYGQYGMTVEYVGNPVVDAVNSYQFDSDFAKKHKINKDQAIAILPGSRKQEVTSMVALVASVAKCLSEYTFVVSKVNNLGDDLYYPLGDISNVILTHSNSYDILNNSIAAIVNSGTATLETALLKVPQVVCYRTSRLTYSLAKYLIKVKYISLVNLILDRSAIKELIQDELNTNSLQSEVTKLVENTDYRQKIVEDYAELASTLGTNSASKLTAEKIVGYLRG